MGLPPDIEYGNNCLACFPAGFTPATVYASIAGVMIGDLWIPGNPYPPNGMFELPQLNGCQWGDFFGPWTVVYNANGGAAWLESSWAGLPQGFDSGNKAPCTNAFTNIHQNKALTKYYGGAAQVGW